MRLEDLTIVLRPRMPWEAVDLGCALVRRDYGRLLGLWAITVVPLWIILAAALWRQPAIFMVVVWWLKPLYDRVPLHFISSAAFGVKPTLREALRQWPRLWSRFLFSALVLRRFSPVRSFALPVWMLEGQRGAAVRRRIQSLATEGSTSAFYATTAFSALELVIAIGLWLLTKGIAPESGLPSLFELMDSPQFDFNPSLAFLWYLNLIYVTAITIAEPFYVGAGFGLYINSRTKLEGWDIELTFRKLAARLRSAAAAVAAVMLVLAFPVQVQGVPLPDRSTITPNRATGPQTAGQPSADTEVSEAAKSILAKPEFEIHKQKRTVWTSKDEDLEKEKDANGDSNNWFDGSPVGAIQFALNSLGWICVAGIVGLVVWLIYRNRHLLGFRISKPLAAKPKGPRVVMGMDIARESLPMDLITSARNAWQNGRPREALSLLYRGALSHLVEQRRLPIRDSDTEDDCLDHVIKSGEPGVTDYFRHLTLLWVRAAYAGVEAGAEEFENLCRGWPFQAAPSKSRHAPQTVLLGLLAFLPALLIGCKGEKKEIEFTTGYKGAARSNPFLAAGQLLEQYGHKSQRLTVLKKMPAGAHDVLILSGEAGMTEARSRQLLTWVSGGGHLIYALAGCRPYNDFTSSSGDQGYAYFGNDKRTDPLLKSLDVTATDRRDKSDDSSADKTDEKDKAPKKKRKRLTDEKISVAEDVATKRNQVTWKGQIYQLELPDYVSFGLKRDLAMGEFSAGPSAKASVLSLKHGSGRVTLLNHARPLRNRYLADHDHARWLMSLVGPYSNNVQFVLTIETSIWRMLWQKAWMPVLVLGVLTLFWLWRSMPRFGPVSHVDLHDTKHFSDHIGALGHFFHSLRRDDILLNAAADAVRARALRRLPHLKGLGDKALLPILAERSGLSEERIETLLTPAVPKQPYQLVRLLQDLQLLRVALG